MIKVLNSSVKTPLGPFSLAVAGEIVIETIFGIVSELRHQGEFIKVLPNISSCIEQYFDGELHSLARIEVGIKTGGFTGIVYGELRKIVPGAVLTYRELATNSGSKGADRAAGSACAKNKIPLLIPCHRVIKSDGALGGYAFGLERKKWLLKHEDYLVS